MIQLTTSQKVSVSVSGLDSKGFPAPLENVTFTSSDETIATVTSDGSASAVVTSVAPGSVQIQVSADAKIGDGETILPGTLDVVVIPGEAVTLTIATGTPEEQSSTPTPLAKPALAKKK